MELHWILQRLYTHWKLRRNIVGLLILATSVWFTMLLVYWLGTNSHSDSDVAHVYQCTSQKTRTPFFFARPFWLTFAEKFLVSFEDSFSRLFSHSHKTRNYLPVLVTTSAISKIITTTAKRIMISIFLELFWYFSPFFNCSKPSSTLIEACSTL